MAGASRSSRSSRLRWRIRVGNATGNTVLKGAGEHRHARLRQPRDRRGQPGAQRPADPSASVSSASPSARSSRSRSRRSSSSIPRRVPPGRPAARAGVAQCGLPAVWPAFVVGVVLAGTRHISSGTLLAVVLQAVGGGCCTCACSMPSRSGAAIGRCIPQGDGTHADAGGSRQRSDAGSGGSRRSIGGQTACVE